MSKILVIRTIITKAFYMAKLYSNKDKENEFVSDQQFLDTDQICSFGYALCDFSSGPMSRKIGMFFLY